MADVFTKEKRSEIMSSIGWKDTKPELLVRKYLFSKGYRFRIHQKNLPGKPDIVLKKFNTVIMINGCFWHGHENCKEYKIPKTNSDFWKMKIEKNVKRDNSNHEKLINLGWRVIVIWECQLENGNREKTLCGIVNDLRNC
jgi:DNA mismatch endonuclease (patch repair protein)